MTSKRHRHSHNDSHSHDHSSDPSSSPSFDPTRLLPFLTAHFGSAEIVERIPLAKAKVEDAILEESNDDEILDGEALLPRQIILVVVDEKEVEIDLVKMVSSNDLVSPRFVLELLTTSSPFVSFALQTTTCSVDPPLGRKVHSVLGMAIATITPLSVAYAAVGGKALEGKTLEPLEGVVAVEDGKKEEEELEL